MSAPGLLLNVVDVEATCWDGAIPPGQASEIIEIGLTVVDLAGRERVERHRLLVRPTRSTVSPFCTGLTGLTQQEVEAGIGFDQACLLLATRHETRRRIWASWGDYDRKMFSEQCRATSTAYPFGSWHLNAKALFATSYGLTRGPGMACALTLAGLELEGRHHRGDDDAWNIAALVLRLVERGHWPAAEEAAGCTGDTRR